MWDTLAATIRWLLGPEAAEAKPRPVERLVEFGASTLGGAKPVGTIESPKTASTHLWARWIFLRALGLIYFSAFYSLVFQAKGLIGPNGILPASDYLQAVAATLHGGARYWFAPSLLWLSASDRALMLLCWAGLIASVLLVLNICPRGMIAICFFCFLSFVSTLQDFASYQSDGMLQEAGFISLFFAPAGFLPGLGRVDGPSRLSRFLLQWEWFRIYFQSGVVKIASGDPSWRKFTAMDDYYQNGPLPTWIGWYVQHLPRAVHVSAVILTFAVELVIVWMMFLPRRFRIICFLIVTPFEIMIILTANYTFLNYLVLALGFLLLDDEFIEGVVPEKYRRWIDRRPAILETTAAESSAGGRKEASGKWVAGLRMTVAAICLGVMFYASTTQLVWMFIPELPLPTLPIRYLEPFRLADRYGLFAVMTHARYEIEFQGSRDGNTWIAFPFRYKPQELNKAPGIYAPYQPRFEWNLWFASLGNWQQYRFVAWTEERLLHADPDVLSLFARNPFAGGLPPKQVRALVWQYWFTDLKTKSETGDWWRREELGDYAPALEREADGKIIILGYPTADIPPP